MPLSISRMWYPLLLSLCFLLGVSGNYGGPSDGELLQDIVTWDEHSIFIDGERVMLFSGEFHPFRLPVPSLWLDVLQKVKAAGFNCVSFYIDWALLEGTPGDFRSEGVFALEPFFQAASEAGVYLIPRPGPYINAEVSGGGFPGWLQNTNATLRTPDPAYLRATDLYVEEVGKIISDAQITEGGPVIMLQAENEYTMGIDGTKFPDRDYVEYVMQQYRDSGIVVPIINNEAHPYGILTPGDEKGAPDIYSHDGYPVSFDCANPDIWVHDPADWTGLPTDWRALHEEQSPSTPYSIMEFQGGAFDPWGGAGTESCSALVNHEVARVYYKNIYSFGATIFNIYMTYGGTNWGNLGYPGGYTSYDYGAAITEQRLVNREKYSEIKLQANFLHASPAYLVADGRNSSRSLTTNPDITVTPATSPENTQFYFVRHSEYDSLESTEYKLHIQSQTLGDITIPQLNSNLTLNGRDSKIHVCDYNLGEVDLLYSTAEIFTWKQYSDKTVLVVYGGPDEHHELAVETSALTQEDCAVLEGSGVTITTRSEYVILSWETKPERRVVELSEPDLQIHILDRNSGYNYWVLGEAYSFATPSVIVKAGYLMRNAEVTGDDTLSLTGDINATTTIEIIGGGPSNLSILKFNGDRLPFTVDEKTGIVKATVEFQEPDLTLPDLSCLPWKYIDSLPEIQDSYDDSSWKSASLERSPNSFREITTPTSLYAGDYGYYAGIILFRGHFTANGGEETFSMEVQGGWGFGASAWIGSEFLGSWEGSGPALNGSSTFDVPDLVDGEEYVISIVLDTMGLEHNWVVGVDEMKTPRGIMNYELDGHPQSDVEWKIAGNLGGEDYIDLVRGPLNEGGLFAERQGYHLPAPPMEYWDESPGGPLTGIEKPGVAFYATEFELDLPDGYDVPLSFVFGNNTEASEVTAYRAQLFVNGWQFGEYVNNVGPQVKFHVPEGILDYHGTNWIGFTLWALNRGGAKVESLSLEADAVVQTGLKNIELSWRDEWQQRDGAY